MLESLCTDKLNLCLNCKRMKIYFYSFRLITNLSPRLLILSSRLLIFVVGSIIKYDPLWRYFLSNLVNLVLRGVNFNFVFIESSICLSLLRAQSKFYVFLEKYLLILHKLTIRHE